jgi:hypothetical protein
MTPETQEAPLASGTVVSVTTLAQEDLIKVASARGLIAETDSTKDINELIKLVEDDKQEVTLATDELVLLKNDTLKTIAVGKDLKFRSNTTKSALVTLISGK